jgi:dsRNA-specific ribonuclease
MTIPAKPSKTVLNEFYQKLKGQAPRFEIQEVLCDGPGKKTPEFICNLFLASIEYNGDRCDEQTFNARAQTKKKAQDEAAKIAVEHLSPTPIFQAVFFPKTNESLWDVLGEAFGNKVGSRALVNK